jgi:antitoxin component of RelBE/YafQ-DinJ toxin-antitoxin module
MAAASILIKTDPKIKKQEQKIAGAMGVSLTSVINRYLKHFVATKTITFSAEDDVYTEYFQKSMKQSEKEAKEGNVISFASPADAISYLKNEIEDEERTAH